MEIGGKDEDWPASSVNLNFSQKSHSINHIAFESLPKPFFVKEGEKKCQALSEPFGAKGLTHLIEQQSMRSPDD